MSSNKPFPSSDLDVFKENSLILDNFVNSQENEHPDRFARKRPTITGIIREAFNVRTDISNMNETLIGQSRWDVVPKNTSLSLGGDNGALNKQAQALFNRTEMLKVHAREALRRTYLEAGYNLVEGSFEQGGTLNTVTDVLLEEKTGKVYSWSGGFPKVVNKGTLPTSEVEYIDKTDSTLKEEVDRINMLLLQPTEVCLVNTKDTGFHTEIVDPQITPTIGVNTRINLNNPFGKNTPVTCAVEVKYNGTWGETGFVSIGSVGGHGAAAFYVQGMGITLQTGDYAILGSSPSTGNPFGNTDVVKTPLPFRVRVKKN